MLWVPNLHRRSEGGPSGTFFLAEGIALAAVLIAAVASGRRAALAAALLLVAAGPWGPEALFQVLFLAAALWQAYVAVAAHRQQRPDRHRRP